MYVSTKSVYILCGWLHIGDLYYSPFTYFGSSNFFRFFLPYEILWRNCFVRLMWYTSTFWKCIWFENMGSITKAMSMNVKNVTWRFCPFFPFGMVKWHVGWIAADFYPFPFNNSFLQRVCLLRIVTQRVKVLTRLLPCSGVTGKWHLSGNS